VIVRSRPRERANHERSRLRPIPETPTSTPLARRTARHRHDFEHVISWINQASNQVEYVTTTQHSSQVTYTRSQVRFDGSHPKVVYHKDGASTHFFRLANSNDEPPENHYHNWRYPPIVDWNGWPGTGLRTILMNADFGSATIKITDKDDRFRNLLNASKPSGIPFDPWA
jgi:Necrosis inducing protein (NPP1)